MQRAYRQVIDKKEYLLTKHRNLQGGTSIYLSRCFTLPLLCMSYVETTKGRRQDISESYIRVFNDIVGFTIANLTPGHIKNTIDRRVKAYYDSHKTIELVEDVYQILTSGEDEPAIVFEEDLESGERRIVRGRGRGRSRGGYSTRGQVTRHFVTEQIEYPEIGGGEVIHEEPVAECTIPRTSNLETLAAAARLMKSTPQKKTSLLPAQAQGTPVILPEESVINADIGDDDGITPEDTDEQDKNNTDVTDASRQTTDGSHEALPETSLSLDASNDMEE
uniref:Integrase core domain containing protein n=1 Tax=Strongyloides papillosus TaxID=174720 RepID=A0A0N5B4Q4_STREA